MIVRRAPTWTYLYTPKHCVGRTESANSGHESFSGHLATDRRSWYVEPGEKGLGAIEMYRRWKKSKSRRQESKPSKVQNAREQCWKCVQGVDGLCPPSIVQAKNDNWLVEAMAVCGSAVCQQNPLKDRP